MKTFYTITPSNSHFALFTRRTGKQGKFVIAEVDDIEQLSETSITLTRAAPVHTICQTGQPSVLKGYYRRRAADQMEIRPGQQELMKQKGVKKWPRRKRPTQTLSFSLTESNCFKFSGCKIAMMTSPYMWGTHWFTYNSAVCFIVVFISFFLDRF